MSDYGKGSFAAAYVQRDESLDHKSLSVLRMIAGLVCLV